MTLQTFLKTLKTAKRTYPCSVYNLLIYSSSITQTLNSPKTPPRSDLNPSTFRRILSDPSIKSYKCISLFNFILENPSLFSFQPDLTTHLSLTLRVLSERKFIDASQLLKSVAIDENLRYPFHEIASNVSDELKFESKLVARFFNSILMVYSKNGNFNEVIEVFEYMKNKEIKIDEKSCTLHLLNLKKADQIELATEFFNLMVGSSLDVSVNALTVTVSALCSNGEIRKARKLTEEMMNLKRVKPNVVTFKSMIDCSVKRWDFEELDSILKLMEKESLKLDLDSYKVLIEGFVSYGKLEEAEKLVSTMYDEKLRVDTYLYNLIIKGYFQSGLAEKAIRLHCEMSSRGVSSDKDTYWILMNELCKVGKVCEALRLFRENEFGIDEDLYVELIDGCCRAGMVDECLEVAAEMVREGFVSDGSVFERVAEALAEAKREEAEMMVSFVVKSGGKPKCCYDLVRRPVLDRAEV